MFIEDRRKGVASLQRSEMSISEMSIEDRRKGVASLQRSEMFIEDRRKVFLTPLGVICRVTQHTRFAQLVCSAGALRSTPAELESRAPVRSINIQSLTGLR